MKKRVGIPSNIVGKIILLALAISFVSITAFSLTTDKKEYMIGESVEITVDVANYDLKIRTPNENLAYLGERKPSIIYKPGLPGSYLVEAYNNTISKSTDFIVLPGIAEGDADNNDFSAEESPSFEVRDERSLKLINPDNDAMQANIVDNQVVLESSREIRPGKYKIIQTGNETEFTWGLVSINSEKSIYKPGETAEFEIVVLDSRGFSVCDAAVEMKLSKPSGLDVYLSAKQLECGLYAASNLVDEEGRYGLAASTVLEGNTVSFDTFFIVQTNYPYDIIRKTYSKIDPTITNSFGVDIDIISYNNDKNAVIKEYVPVAFELNVEPGAKVENLGNEKIISWSKQLIGDKASVHYDYSVPLIWPRLYALGPLNINGFGEARPWYVAVDPTDTLTPILHANTENNGADLSSAEVTAITTDDTSTVEVVKGKILTSELTNVSQQIQTLTDVDCSLVYNSGSISPTGNFSIYDSFNGDVVGSTTISSSASDNTITLSNLQDNGLTASEVNNMVAYVENRDDAAPASIFVDRISCSVVYTPVTPSGNVTVTLNLPIDNGVYGNRNVSFEYTPKVSTRFSNCSLYSNVSGSWAFTKKNTTAISNNTQNSIFYQVAADGTYKWNVLCYDTQQRKGTAVANFTVDVDTRAPNVTFKLPANNSILVSTKNLSFTYNVTDKNIVNFCTFLVNNTARQNDTTITENINQGFNQYLANGFYKFRVTCNDEVGNKGYSGIHFFTLNIPLTAWQNRWYETFSGSNFSSIMANIFLDNNRDNHRNQFSGSVSSSSLLTFVNATSQYMGSNGAYISRSSRVSFSGAYTVSSTNRIYITWAAYLTNGTSNSLICQSGNNNTGGTVISSASQTITGSCTTSSEIRLKDHDKLKLIINSYNSHVNPVTLTHLWDGNILSYAEFGNFTTLGTLSVNLTNPANALNIAEGQTFTQSCQASCSVGSCLNTRVYAQYNTTGGSWANISGSGNLILNTGETNPHSLGTVYTGGNTTNFTIRTNAAARNYVRCFAVSNYSTITGTRAVLINVSGTNKAPRFHNMTDNSTATYPRQGETILLNITITDDSDISHIRYATNDSGSWTNASWFRPVATTLHKNSTREIVNTASGAVGWRFYANDSNGLLNRSSIATYTVKTNKAPAFYSFADNSTASEPKPGQRINLSLTITDDRNIDFIRYATNDSGSWTNASWFRPVATTSHFNYTVETVNTLNGAVGWRFYANDSNSALNSSSIRTYQVKGNRAPTFTNFADNSTLSAPRQGERINLSLNINDDEDIDYVRYATNDSGSWTNASWFRPSATTTYFNYTIETVNTLSGTVGWRFYANDSDSSINSSSIRTYTVKTNKAPAFYSFADNSTATYPRQNEVINLSLTITDDINIDFIRYATNDSGSWTNASWFKPTAITTYFNYTRETVNTASGTVGWRFYANDSNSLINSSSIRTYTVKANKVPAFYNLADNSTVTEPKTGQVINLSLTITDDRNVDFIRYATNDSGTWTNASWFKPSTSTSYFNYTRETVNTLRGAVGWRFYANDSNSGTNSSSIAIYQVKVSIAPTVSLTNPANNAYFNYTSIRLFYNATDVDNDLKNSTLIINNAKNKTNSSALRNKQINNFTVTLPQGKHSWTVNVSDASGNAATANKRNVTIDTKDPGISLYNPTSGQTLSVNNVTFNFSVLDNLSPSFTCNLTVNSTAELTNFAASNNTFTTKFLLRNDGVYNWTVNCVDLAQNNNISLSRIFTVEAPPSVTLQSPANNTRTKQQTNITFSYLPSDDSGITECSFILDGTTIYTDTGIQNKQTNTFTRNLTEGKHKWTVKCIDAFPDFNEFTAGNRTIYKDITAPNITLNAPANASILNFGNNTFNWTAMDSLDATIRCNLTVDYTVRYSNVSSTNATATYKGVTGLNVARHNWTVSCWDTVNNTRTSQLRIFNISKPDLRILVSDITVNNTNPRERESVLINATVSNIGGVAASNIIVQFRENGPNGLQINGNKTISSIAAGGTGYTSIIWNAKVGPTNITVAVDPPLAANGSINEIIENNNHANKSAIISGWHIVYGNLTSTSRVELAGNVNNSAYTWNINSFDHGNVYIADSDSSISFSNLQALTRTKTNGSASSDFSELDGLLASNNFNDSVSDLFTLDGSTPKKTRDFYMFNRKIWLVPIINSTNSSSFLTGILWDGSDDSGNNQFDNTDIEDVVFVTKVNLTRKGKYGTYDYEIRVPATLRQYKTTSNGVTLYAEIK